MKSFFSPLTEVLKKASAPLVGTTALLAAQMTHAALPEVDLNADSAGGKTLDDLMEQTGSVLDTAAGLGMAIAAFIGFVIVIVSAYTIWKASKDEREKPTSAVVGIFVGGLLLAVPTIMWMSRNALFGS